MEMHTWLLKRHILERLDLHNLEGILDQVKSKSSLSMPKVCTLEEKKSVPNNRTGHRTPKRVKYFTTCA